MRKKKKSVFLLIMIIMAGWITGCNQTSVAQPLVHKENSALMESEEVKNSDEKEADAIIPGTDIMQLEDGFSAVSYEGDYWFDDFLWQGGASGDSEVIGFLNRQLSAGGTGAVFETGGFGCSTLAVKNPEGEALFGRNFDWQTCEAMVVCSQPSGAYASVSTVNMDFIRSGYGAGFSRIPDEVRIMIALYAPLDGMNEMGLAVSVNMIQDSDTISQDTGKPDLTTTTAIRLLLDQAADVEEAVALLKQYDMHSSMGMMVHFALADRDGRSVVVEYVRNEMVVTETPVVTNFYLADGEKQGIGSAQSHTRYEVLMEDLSEDGAMSVNQVRDALDSVSKDNFREFESTEWSVVFHLSSGEARYYHREDYETSYLFRINQ